MCEICLSNDLLHSPINRNRVYWKYYCYWSFWSASLWSKKEQKERSLFSTVHSIMVSYSSRVRSRKSMWKQEIGMAQRTEREKRKTMPFAWTIPIPTILILIFHQPLTWYITAQIPILCFFNIGLEMASNGQARPSANPDLAEVNKCFYMLPLPMPSPFIAAPDPG